MQKNNDLKKSWLKNRTCYYFSDKNKIENSDFCNILLDKKSYIKTF